jgi:phosphotransferase system HPr (HPr) family protein
MVEKETVVGHAKLHARPAALLVHRAKQFDSEVKLEKGGKSKNAKSVMGIMALGALEGDKIKVRAQGPDEEKAAEAVAAVVSGEGS